MVRDLTVYKLNLELFIKHQFHLYEWKHQVTVDFSHLTWRIVWWILPIVIQFKVQFSKLPLLFPDKTAQVHMWVSRKLFIHSAFIALCNAFEYQLPKVILVHVYLAIKCISGPFPCSLDQQSNWPTKLQSLHPGESHSFQPNQQKCSTAPDCCLIGY